MNWLYELKVGDKFLSLSESSLGVVTDNKNNYLYWTWFDRRTGKRLGNHEKSIRYLIELKPKWKKLTPLTQELI